MAMGRIHALSTLTALAAMLTMASGASAGYAAPGLCEEGTAYDYAKPLKRLPAAHLPPADGHLPFAPSRVFFARAGSPSLITGSGEVGYRLYFVPYEKSERVSSALNWHVSARIARVDRRGAAIEVLGEFDREVGRLRPDSEEAANALSLTSEVSKPGLYRTEVTLADSSDRRLAHYSEYHRVLRRSLAVDLRLASDSFHPGETVAPTLENKGTESLTSGLDYAIESFDGSAWSRAAISPSSPTVSSVQLTGPGKTSSCWDFQIPATAAPGLYRFSWSGNTLVPLPPGRYTQSLVRSAEFTILPG